MQLNKPKIFISHSWEDKPFVQRVEADLKSAGADVWVDHSKTRGGDNLPKRINEALEWKGYSFEVDQPFSDLV